MRKGKIVLEVKQVTQRFGSLPVLLNLDMKFHENEIVGIIGPNGAGKTTLFNIMTGIYKPAQGSVWLDNENITGLPAYQIARKGFARTFQNIRLFQNLTVLDNVLEGMNTNGKSTLLDALLNLPRKRKEDNEVEA